MVASAVQPKTPILTLPERREVALVRGVAINKLRFSPYAWAKYNWMRDRSNNEVAAFGISSRSDITYIEDIRLLKQTVSGASAEFDEDDIPRYLDDMIDEGYQPLECMRIWLHTHPGHSASPSGTDEKTFEEAFGRADWAVMCILAQGGEIKAKVCLTAANGQFRHDFTIPITVDCTGAFSGVTKEDVERWEDEYVKYVQCRTYVVSTSAVNRHGPSRPVQQSWHDWSRHGQDRYDDIDWDEIENWRKEYAHATDDSHDVASESALDIDGVATADFDLSDEFDYPEFIVETLQKEKVIYVLMEEHWLAYELDVGLTLREGEAVRCAKDLCEELPIAYGELSWDYGAGEAEAISISDCEQTIGLYTSMTFDDVNEMIEGWLAPVESVSMQDAIDSAGDAADKLAEQYAKEQDEGTTDPSAETVYEGQPICEGQPDARPLGP